MTASFDTAWLRLREQHDAAARAADLVPAIAAMLAEDQPIALADLGSGLGANARFLAEQLPGRQAWTLIDNDPDLLAAAHQAFLDWAAERGWTAQATGDLAATVRVGERPCTFTAQVGNLGDALESLVPERVDIITASALLDLASRAWLDRLAALAAERHAHVLIGMSYDGRIAWNPADIQDPAMLRLINQHQRRDKGLGSAAGPEAGPYLADRLAARGYAVATAQSDWQLGPDATDMMRHLLADWAAAAEAEAPERREQIQAWRARRETLIASGDCWLTVGHSDLSARLLAG